MCGGKSQTVQQTTIPPEVLARYNAVNARAEDVAKQPFKQYGGEFVAPINEQQRMGIGGINQAAGMAQGQMTSAQNILNQAYQTSQPYMQQALGTAGAAYGQAQNQLGQAQGYLTNAASQGQIYGGQAYQPIAGALGSAQPYMQTATELVGGGLGAAAPMMGAAEGYLGGGTQAIAPQEFGQAQINKYMSPYMKNVVEAQQALQQQESAAQRSALNSQAIGAGAFGGDRAGIAQANLARQQSLANQATLGNLLQQGYGQAAGMFQQQQGVNLAAQQANRAAQQFGSQQAANLAQQRYAQQMGAGQQLAALGQQQFAQNIGAGQAMAGLGQQMYQQGLGASQAAQGLGQAAYGMGAQQGAFQQGIGSALYGMGTQQATTQAALAQQQQAAALQGAQAQIGAGTLEQQTRQAEDTARYQQFLQERGYDFQVAQFLANIAMGTGALSGSTTTTTQPNSFFSDRRLKKDIKEIGETHDGLPIYSFKYKGGDDQQRIGVMADEAREKHPDAVHRVGGIDAVDYEKIANRASEGGGVLPHRARQGFASDGFVQDPTDRSGMAASHRTGEWGPFYDEKSRGALFKGLPGVGGIVPQKGVYVSQLKSHGAPPQQQSGARQVMAELGQANQLGETVFGDKGLVAKGKQAYNYVAGKDQKQPSKPADQGGANTSVPQPKLGVKPADQPASNQKNAELSPDAGGVIPRTNVAMDTSITPPDEDIFMPTTTVARGGVIPHKAAGGPLREGVLPYQSEDPYGVEAVNEAESGEKYDLLKPDAPPPKQKSGFENVLDAAKLATKVVGMFMVKNGGAIKGNKYEYGGGVRPGYQRAGAVTEEGSSNKEYTMDDYLNALSKIESSHNYEALGPRTKSGDRAYGRYQVMGANVPSWTQEHYGQSLSPEEFRANKEAQDAVARGQFGKYLNQYGSPEDAASVWFSGRPMSKAGNASDITGTTVPAYVQRFRSALGLGAPEGGEQARRQVAGAEYEDGKSYVDGKRVYDGGITPPTEYRSGKPFESWGDFLTSRQFVVPLLSGVGAMASSPSRYFGGALLQGVGAAAQSYAGMEKPITEAEEKRAATGTQQAVTELTYRDLVNKAINADQKTGIILGVNVYKNGQATTVSVQEFNKALREGRPYALDPRGQYVAREELPERGSAGTAAGQPAGTPGAPGAAGQTAPQQPVYKNVDASTDKILQNNGQWISSGGTAGIDPKDMRYNPFSTAAGQASVALNQTAERNAYANAFANMDKSNLSKFATDITLPTSAYINGVIRKANGVFGTDIPEITPDQIGNAKVIEKIATRLAGLQDAATGQKSFASFAQWLNTVPTTANDPQSAAKLISDILVQSQMPIDKAAYFDRAQQHALDKGYVVNENQAQYLGRGLEQNFQQSMARQYALEKQQLSKMLFEPLSYKDASGKQVNGTVIGYLTGTGGYAPAGMLKAMKEKGYSPELLRYFGGRS